MFNFNLLHITYDYFFVMQYLHLRSEKVMFNFHIIPIIIGDYADYHIILYGLKKENGLL